MYADVPSQDINAMRTLLVRMRNPSTAYLLLPFKKPAIGRFFVFLRLAVNGKITASAQKHLIIGLRPVDL
jgi:hypothetical protein